jgi:AcrR family transcriptional regulator
MPRTERANQAIREEREAAIRAAAARVFAHNGYVGTRVEDIAQAVAMSKGLLYHYFGSKEDLYTTLVKRAAGGTVALFQEALRRPGGSPARLRWLVSQVLVGLAEQPDMFMVVLQAFASEAVPPAAREEARRFALRSQELLGDLVRQGQEAGELVPGDPAQFAVLLGSCIQGLAVGHAITGTVPPLADALVALFTGRQEAAPP